jgi:hypothetical protein
LGERGGSNLADSKYLHNLYGKEKEEGSKEKEATLKSLRLLVKPAFGGFYF